MKMLHISAIPNAGAGLCAVRINNALVKEGVESKMLFRDGRELPEGVDGAIAKYDVVWLDHHRMLQRGLHFLVMSQSWGWDCPFSDATA